MNVIKFYADGGTYSSKMEVISVVSVTDRSIS